jgi:hypothetical protein
MATLSILGALLYDGLYRHRGFLGYPDGFYQVAD